MKYLLTLVALLMLVPVQAAAQPCFSHGELARILADRFGETSIGGGKTSDGELLELFVSSTTQSWSMAITNPGGQTCVVVVGIRWNASQPKSINYKAKP